MMRAFELIKPLYHTLIVCVALVFSVVTSSAQQSNWHIASHPEDCEMCLRAAELLNEAMQAPDDRECNEAIREYARSADLEHVVLLARVYVKNVINESSNENIVSLGIADKIEIGHTLFDIFDSMISSSELITSMADGRPYNLFANWNEDYSFKDSFSLLPGIIIDTIAMLDEYTYNIKNGVRSNGYFHNAQRAYIEEYAYGDTRYMNRYMPDHDATINRLIDAFGGYMTFSDDFTREDMLACGWSAWQHFIDMMSPNDLTNIHHVDVELANLIIDNIYDVMMLVVFNVPESLMPDYGAQLMRIAKYLGREADCIEAQKRGNEVVYGAQGVLYNAMFDADAVSADNLLEEYEEYRETLKKRGYDFARYAPYYYPEEIRDRDKDAYAEYCYNTSLFLCEVFKILGVQGGGVHAVQSSLEYLAQFIGVDDVIHYTLHVGCSIYDVDPRVGLATIESCLPTANRFGVLIYSPSTPYIVRIYQRLGNDDMSEGIIASALLPFVRAVIDMPANSYVFSRGDIVGSVGMLDALCNSKVDRSDVILQFIDVLLEQIEKHNRVYRSGESPYFTVLYYIDIAEALIEMSQVVRAEELVAQAIDIYNRNSFSKEQRDALNACIGSFNASVCMEREDYEGLIRHFLEIEPYYGTFMVLKDDTYAQIAYAASCVGNYELMGRTAQQCIEHIRSTVQNTMFNLNGGAREMFWDKWSKSGERLVGAYLNAGDLENNPLIGAIYDWNLISKGLLLTANNIIDYRLKHSDDASVRELYELYQVLAMELERSSAQSPDSDATLTLQQQVRAAENTLVGILRGEYDEGVYDKLSVSWSDIRRALPKHGVAIEFMRIDSEASGGAKYVALVLRKEWKSPRLVEVCSEEALAPYISLDRRTNLTLYNSVKSKRLYEIVWGNVDEYLTPNDIVYYSTDGLLHQTNPESMRVADSDAKLYADDLYDLRRVSSTREIALEHRDADYTRAALFGNLNYNMGDSEVESIDIAEGNTTYITSRTLGAGASNMVPRTSLPWSEDLIYNVSDILSTADVTSDIYLREQGTENAFKQLSGSATDIIHLYTHGFYMEGITEYQDSEVELSPMMRSGLVMAGSPNVALNSDNDGLLLAREIADMDLSYVDIVFLSACQTAQGEITSDGVVGIQRGLKQAGVNTIIMTLWEVDAMMSVYLVEEFYRALSQPGVTKRDAFREARRKARENYPTLDWAAYIMLD